MQLQLRSARTHRPHACGTFLQRATAWGGFIISSLTLAACSREVPNTLTSAAAEVEVQAFWTDYIAALKDGDAQRVTAFYRDSVYLLEPGLPTLRTQAEVLSAAREVLASARILDSRILPELTEVFGSSVAQYGSYVDSLEAPGQKPFHRYGRFSAMLSRDAGGRWRLSRLTALVDSTPGAAPPSGGP